MEFYVNIYTGFYADFQTGFYVDFNKLLESLFTILLIS